LQASIVVGRCHGAPEELTPGIFAASGQLVVRQALDRRRSSMG